MKVDGCGDNSYYPFGYNAMGAALEASGRDIVYRRVFAKNSSKSDTDADRLLIL